LFEKENRARQKQAGQTKDKISFSEFSSSCNSKMVDLVIRLVWSVALRTKGAGLIQTEKEKSLTS